MSDDFSFSSPSESPNENELKVFKKESRYSILEKPLRYLESNLWNSNEESQENIVPNISIQITKTITLSHQKTSASHLCLRTLSDVDHTSKLDKEFKQFMWLKENGYDKLADRLSHHKGDFWDKVRCIESPLLMEQLIDLYDVCQGCNPKNKKQANDKLLTLGLSIAQSVMNTDGTNHKAHLLLGKVIYLANKCPLLTAKLIDPEHPLAHIDLIEQRFEKDLAKIQQKLRQHYQNHLKTPLQDADVAVKTLLSIELSKALITDTGTFNIGIIPALLESLFSKNSNNYEAHIASILKSFQLSHKLRSDLEKIHKPENPSTKAYQIIRIAMGLSSKKAVVTDAHARRTALAALLEQLRQGHSISCFAASAAIHIQSSHPELCLKDFAQLLHDDRLTRHIEGSSVEFPFLMKMNSSSLDKPIYFDDNNYLYLDGKKSGFLWDSPGIQAACQILGIDNVKDTVETVINLKLKSSSIRKTTVNEMIQALTEQSTDDIVKRGFLYSAALFAFLSQTTNPLLPAWENAIAGMAEVGESSLIKTASIGSIIDTLSEKIDSLEGFAPKLKDDLIDCIEKKLFQDMRFQYDPSLISQSLSSNIHPKEGGFVLYDMPQPSKKKGEELSRIDTGQRFQSFIQRILARTSGKVPGSEPLTEYLNQFVGSDEFLLSTQQKYDRSDITIQELFSEENTLKVKPYETLSGNDSKKVLEVYYETNQPLITHQFNPITAEELLANVIKLSKELSPEERYSYVDNPTKLTPARIPGNHTFSLMLGPLLNKSDDWVQKNLIEPGLKVMNSNIDIEMRNNIIRFVLYNLAPEAESTKFLSAIKLIRDPISIKDFRNSLLALLSSLDASSARKQSQLLDAAIYQALPPNLKKILESSAIPIGDSNWAVKTHNINLCIAMGPDGKLQVCEAYDDGSHLTPLNQKQWLNRPWEVF